ncbi:GNAT family N-acetyltransferase [Bacillus sp. SG-1]|uniref:GNAT family N-acetyltransferase n=1 Tax=Bacillus sp. SG-1 TaxID=161544 RepID=UPI00015432E9|nr:GNAT family N-acetyltransferase [Bacillus sp. SG-1]EDL64720.1 acetyltransferase, GNAT family protein [Bacillus sp. SG-1]
MTIKRLDKSHYEESLNLSMYAFQYKVPEEEKENRFRQLDDHELYGIEADDQLAAKLHLLSLNVFLGEKEFKMGGIAGVATYPEYRRKGYVKELLTYSLKRMREKGQTISMLHPFSFAFYRKYGWELFSTLKRVKVAQAEMKMFDGVPGNVKRFNKENYPSELEEIYNGYARRFSGMLAREKTWWKERSITNLNVAIYYDGKGNGAGYILYDIKDQKMKVEEFIVLNAEARSGLWNFICQHDSMLTGVELVLSPEDPLVFLLENPKTPTELQPYFMTRVVDVLSFLEQFRSSIKEKVSLEVSDKYAPWNNGTFTITSEKVIKEEEECSRTVQMDVNALVPLFFGVYSSQQLYEMGVIKGDRESVAVLNKIRVKPGFFIDFF